jgi:hypothetical protein
MKDLRVETAKNGGKAESSSGETIALHLCYRQIGISAVAAAARYQGSAKNPAYAPVGLRSDRRDPPGA